MENAHAEQDIQKFKNYREQCYQIIDLSLVNQATKRESHAEVVRSVQQVLFRENGCGPKARALKETNGRSATVDNKGSEGGIRLWVSSYTG